MPVVEFRIYSIIAYVFVYKLQEETATKYHDKTHIYTTQHVPLMDDGIYFETTYILYAA